MSWVTQDCPLPITRQCELAQVSRASFYGRREADPVGDEDLLYMRLLDEEYTRHPLYGSRRMGVFLRHGGCRVTRKRVQRPMRGMSLAGMAPGPSTRRPPPHHQHSLYLLRILLHVGTDPGR